MAVVVRGLVIKVGVVLVLVRGGGAGVRVSGDTRSARHARYPTSANCNRSLNTPLVMRLVITLPHGPPGYSQTELRTGV